MGRSKMPKVLYHGTLKISAEEILKGPRRAVTPRVGHNVVFAYGDPSHLPPFVFATTKPRILGWYIVAQLQARELEAEAKRVVEQGQFKFQESERLALERKAYDKLRNVTAFLRYGGRMNLRSEPEKDMNKVLQKHGAVAIFESPDRAQWKYCSKSDIDVRRTGKCADPTVEAGDWYSAQEVIPSRIVTGDEMMRLIGKWKC